MSGPLSPPRNPLRLLFSSSLWAAAWYLLAYQVVGWVLFSAALTAVLTGATLMITVAGIPLLIAAAAVVRWCADVERARLHRFAGEVLGDYRPDGGPGLIGRFTTRWRDPALWRDVAYLTGMFVPLAVLGLIVLTVWLVLLSGITLPAWYWFPWQDVHGVRFHGAQLGYFPNGPHASPGYGIYIDTLPKALLAAVVCLVLFVAFSYVLVATARAHVAAARALLGTPQDPLKEAKEVLSNPGPLVASQEAGQRGLLVKSSPNEL